MSRHLMAGALLASAALAVAGCGDSGNDSASGSTAGAGANVQGAKADLDAIIGGSKEITLPPLGAAAPKGKTISYVNCPLAICVEVGEGVKQATDALGWTYRNVAMNATPAGYKSAWQQIAQNPGDAVVNEALLPDSSIAPLLKKANVPVVAVTNPAPPGPGVLPTIDSREHVQIQGGAEANWVIQDAGKPVKTAFVYDPSIVSIATAYDGYHAALSKNCPRCSVDVLKVSSAKIGPALAQQVVSQLQSNPDIKYVVFGLGDLATGVPAAIASAGLAGKVKVVVRGATPPNLQDVKSGSVAAAFTDEIYEAGWRAVDSLLRQLIGKPSTEAPNGKVYLLTKDNLPADIKKPYSAPGFQDAFKKAWGIS